MKTVTWKLRALGLLATIATLALGLVTVRGAGAGQAAAQGGTAEGRGRANRPTYSLSDPVPQDPALRGAIDMHAHQDPDSSGPSYGQAARSDDAIDLYKRAKAAGMRGFVIKQHLDSTAGYAYYMRKLYPDLEFFGGMGSNLTTGQKVAREVTGRTGDEIGAAIGKSLGGKTGESLGRSVFRSIIGGFLKR